jgi:hypothetical protein
LKRAAAGLDEKGFKSLTKDCQSIAARNHVGGEQGGSSKSQELETIEWSDCENDGAGEELDDTRWPQGMIQDPASGKQ